MITKLKSKVDRSVNWIIPYKKGNLEARYVRRCSDYISAYVSSHSGCKMGCKMCFLTQLNQTWFDHTDIDNFEKQIRIILDHYDSSNEDNTAKRVNINFMSRGEALANKVIINNYDELYDTIEKRAMLSNLDIKMNISTIMPYTVKHRKLEDILSRNTEIYYSLYSVKEDFRKSWLPNALPVKEALHKIKQYQLYSHMPVTFHWAFIKNYNDDEQDLVELVKLVRQYELFGKFNLVRYNPPPNLYHTEEPDEEKLNDLFKIARSALTDNNRSKIVPRVGLDVYASCGTFITDCD